MNAAELGLKHRTATQIVDKNGDPYRCYSTENIWVGYGEQFSFPTAGNEVTPLTTGKDYFKALMDAIQNAREEIYIAGWQVSWDAMLASGEGATPKRLFDVLLEVARRNPTCKIRVMPWDDTSPVQTYDDETRLVLERINKITGTQCVEVRLANAASDQDNAFFTHHQKQVIIDRQIAFVGGIDLAYGRYDDERYLLKADTGGRAALNRYNGCVVPVGRIDPHSVVNPADLRPGQQNPRGVDYSPDRERKTEEAILRGAWEVPLDAYVARGTPRYETLEPATQPRMPWQDVHLMIHGPAVADLTRNFVFRWNALAPRSASLPAPPAPEKKEGGCHVQVLRSAPATLREAEYKALPYEERKRFDAAKASRSTDLPKGPSGAQNDIARAMEILIDKAQHFIYIENQFFVAAFGTPQGYDLKQKSGPAQIVEKDAGSGPKLTTWMPGDSKQLPQNDICALLAGRIGRAILDPFAMPFHVYITLPVHPEGSLSDGSVMTQVHWTMQTLVFGSKSLLNRIRRFIKARELCDKKDPDWGRVFNDGNREYEEIDIKRCFEYVTLLNLRNWDKLGERHVTEQIYVHSKLMVVDDRFAIVGSANINDRSLLGTRDSELAVLLMDSEVEKIDLCGDGKQRPVRLVAHKLRREVWKKIFGITGGIRPANELDEIIDKPGDPKTWKKIQELAARNTELYEAAFPSIPRNHPLGRKTSASIWPIWDPSLRNPEGHKGAKVGFMPFDREFWSTRQHTASAANLAEVKGYITLLPIKWTTGENNNLGYHTALVTENNVAPLPQDPIRQVQASTDRGNA